MKKFTFMLLAAFIAVTAMAGTEKSPMRAEMFPAKAQIGQKLNIKQAPKELTRKVQFSKKARAPKKAATAADFAGDYTWDYLTTSDDWSTDVESLTTTEGTAHVVISESTTTEGGITISGMFSNDLEATVESDGEYNYFVISAGQTAGTSSYGDYIINGLFYYEGDETYEAGWYDSDIHGYVLDDGSIYIDEWMYKVLSTGDYAGYYLNPCYVGGSTLTPADPITVVTPPADLVIEEYVVTARNYDDEADVNASVFIGFDGNDVYIQGLCTYIADAWVKGTLDGTTITFPYGQFFGTYSDYDMYLNVLMSKDVVFTYDAEAGTLTAQNEFFLVDNSQYYFDSYRGCVIKKVTEKAVMPADPQITSLEKSSSYGYYMRFNVPNTDVNGEGLLCSKLYYMIYTDVEGEITPLTFTPATHSNLTEDLTEIPFGFTENWDFYASTIYFNDLFSEDWNKIGIQSIYYGGGETNATEIQWYKIKDYTFTSGDVTFDFNAMDVPTSATGVSDGDFTEDKEFTAALGNTDDVITLTVTTNDEKCTTPNRFWSTSAGPQLRVYSGTMTFEVPAGYTMTGIVFNYNGKYWGGGNNAGYVTADSGEITDDATAKQATWTGDAQSVEFAIGYYDEENDKWISGNTQINSIVVTVEKVELKPVIAPEDLVTEFYHFKGYDTYYEEEVTSNVQVGFYGENEVYIQGLSTGYLPEAWVKGTIEDGIVTIPETNLGIWTYNGEDYEVYFTGATFVYDAEAETFTSTDAGYYTYSGNYRLDEFEDVVVLTKLNDVAATPAAPGFDAIKLVGTSYPYLNLIVPDEDVDGNYVITDKLYYSVWYQLDDEKAQQFIVSADEYKYVEEDWVEVPYSYNDNYDIKTGGSKFYLNPADFDYTTWKRIGVQSIYYGGGERRESEITWIDNPYYTIPVTVSDALYATFVAPVDVDFTDNAVSAFAVTVNGEYAHLEPVTTVPAGTAVVVKAEAAGTYRVAQTTEATLGATNELVAATEDVTADGTQYILAKVDDVVGFYKATGTIAAGKGYLSISSPVKEFYTFGDDATGISGIVADENAVIYNLAGQRVSKTAKGVNIINGKKVLK